VPSSEIRLHARPTKRQLAVTRLRIYVATFIGMQFIIGGLLGPPALWLFFRYVAERPWPASNNFLFVLGPAVAIGLTALVGFGGFNNPQTKSYLEDGARYVIDDLNVSSRATNASSVVSWNLFTGAMEYSDLFVLKIGNVIHLLPKRDLAAGDADVLRELLRTKLGKKAELRSPRS